MKRINNLIAGAIAFVAVILIALLSIDKPEHPYALSQEQALDTTLAYKKMEVLPEDVPSMLKNSSSSCVFVDLRNPGEFTKGHIDGAVNIPFNSLMDPENLEFFREKGPATIAVLYGEDQIQANGPWMILTQLGYENIKVLKGGYTFYATHAPNFSNLPPTPAYMVEEPMYDYKKIVEETPGTGDVNVETEGPEKVVPKRKQKERKISGGC